MASPFLILLLVLAAIPAVANAQTNRNLTLASSPITAANPTTYLLSPSANFAFGFQMIGSGFLLAIWFYKIPQQTIVWSANGDSLAPKGSTLRLTSGNQVLLQDPNGGEIWSANQPGSVFSYASMLDTGNLAVMDQDGKVEWDTFSNPTDTMLPTQVLGPGSQLVARYSPNNYAGGRFSLRMQNNGNLTINSPAIPLISLNSPYWQTNTVGSGNMLVFNQTGQLSLTTSNGTVLSEIISSGLSTDDYYERAVLDYDGVFRLYIHPKSATSGAGRSLNWTTASQPVPSNICLHIPQAVGSGACGYNSYCALGSDQRPNCFCPSGYTWIDPEDQTKGCKQDFAPQICDKDKLDGSQFNLEEMANTNWPLSDYDMLPGKTESWCRQACLSDCLCAVVIYNELNCWKKKVPLSNGRMDNSVTGKAFVKVRANHSVSGSAENKPADRISSHAIIITSVLLGGAVCLNILLAILTFMTCRRLQHRKDDSEGPLLVKEAGGLRHFKYQEIWEATNGFKEELGRGSFGAVYKGSVSSFFGQGDQVVAVKVLYKLTEKGDLEFKREMEAISRTNHKNLVKLHGYCNEDQHRILVYEYMSNSCLANLLFGNSRTNWYKRINIAQGVARGLSYLHEECSTQIIHCDIKPQNVLLDGALVAKISDFGLAKLLVADQTGTWTDVRGTRGYVAPEWFRSMPVSTKVDVYSFGILLLELICCRKNYEPGTEYKPEMVLATWVFDCFHEGNLYPLVEDDEEALGDQSRVERFVRTALWCIQEDPSLRPTMKNVTLMLEGAIPVSVPPEPFSFISSA